ncbi:uncharacterized protein LOC123306640 [Coccinella septempunctata]|uniref:uncharacterized protein LOC123306640 n=1 Tax=Coccinella septempunctata TaxID=41139 RepID=UPI001D07A5D4|nr:uncharacterized protein LOC123306640 [Coccinella septempunctata]
MEFTTGIFLDLTKAYDSVGHELLLRKLEEYGIRGKALQWIRSYLTGRTQKVEITKEGKNYNSELMLMEEIGVVQDDTNILLKSVEVNLLTDLMERCMQNIKEWIAGNGLILNEDKTNVIYFKTSRSRQQTPTTVTIDNKEIKTAKQVKFLGLMLDEHLNWESHIDMITGKLNSADENVQKLNDVYTLPDMDLPVKSVNAKKLKEEWKHLRNVDFADYSNVKPQLPIGQDN